MISPMAVHSLDVAQLEPEFARDGGDGGTATHTRRATWFQSTLINSIQFNSKGFGLMSKHFTFASEYTFS